MLNRRNAFVATLSALVMVAWLAPVVQAQTSKPADATGTWKWTQAFGARRGGGAGGGGGAGRGGAGGPATAPATQPGAGAAAAPGGGGARRGGGGQPREYTLTLKQEGEKVTGKIVGANFQDPTAADDIKEGTIKNGEVAFKLERTFGENTITTTYKGKIEGDTIKGTYLTAFPAGANFGGGGEPQPLEWEAARQK